MADDDRARFALFRRLQEVLGVEHAETLMASLPPPPWSNLATKEDVLLLRKEIADMRDDIDQMIDQKLGRYSRRMMTFYAAGALLNGALVLAT